MGALTWKVGKEGHQQGRSLPKGKPPKTLSKWWNTSNPLSTPQSQMRWKRRTQKLLTFQRNQSRHPNRQKEPKRPWALEAQAAQMAQEAQTTKEAWEVKLQLEVEDIFQVIRKVAWLDMELEWTKFRAFQVEEGPFSLSMNAMAKAIKVLQILVVSERETNMQLSLELKKAQKDKGLGQVEKPQSP